MWEAGVVGLAWMAYTALPHGLARRQGRGVVCRGPQESEAVAFTFDDGPDPELTLEVASLLEQAGARGTFFAVARRAARCSWVLRELVRRGHEVGLHGLTHRHLWTLGPLGTLRQLRQGLQIVEQATGVPVRYYRPPWGYLNGAVLVGCRRLGLEVVLWSAAPWDWWPGLSVQKLRQQLLAALTPGAIIDLHDRAWASRRRVLHQALAQALEEATRRGLRAVTVSSLLGKARGGP